MRVRHHTPFSIQFSSPVRCTAWLLICTRYLCRLPERVRRDPDSAEAAGVEAGSPVEDSGAAEGGRSSRAFSSPARFHSHIDRRRWHWLRYTSPYILIKV